jgi:hypothetical protein
VLLRLSIALSTLTRLKRTALCRAVSPWRSGRSGRTPAASSTSTAWTSPLMAAERSSSSGPPPVGERGGMPTTPAKLCWAAVVVAAAAAASGWRRWARVVATAVPRACCGDPVPPAAAAAEAEAAEAASEEAVRRGRGGRLSWVRGSTALVLRERIAWPNMLPSRGWCWPANRPGPAPAHAPVRPCARTSHLLPLSPSLLRGGLNLGRRGV